MPEETERQFIQIVPDCARNPDLYPCGCELVDVMQTVQNIIDAAVILGTFLLAILLAYVGFLYVTSPVNAANRARARSLAISSIAGFIIVIGAFLIVSTIMSTFAKQDRFGNWTSFFGVERSTCEIRNPAAQPTPNIVGNEQSDAVKHINIVCAAARGAGLNAQYEVRDPLERNALIQEGARCIRLVPQITANHFSVYNSAGCQREVDVQSCPDCVTPTGIDFKDGNKVAESYAIQLLDFKQKVELLQQQEGTSFGWWVTEAFPPEVTHQCGCHNNGTCTDINFR